MRRWAAPKLCKAWSWRKWRSECDHATSCNLWLSSKALNNDWISLLCGTWTNIRNLVTSAVHKQEAKTQISNSSCVLYLLPDFIWTHSSQVEWRTHQFLEPLSCFQRYMRMLGQHFKLDMHSYFQDVKLQHCRQMKLKTNCVQLCLSHQNTLLCLHLCRKTLFQEGVKAYFKPFDYIFTISDQVTNLRWTQRKFHNVLFLV